MAKNPAENQFEALLETYFEGALKADPQMATITGLPAGFGKWGDPSLELEIGREAVRSKTIRTLDTFSPGDLSHEAMLDWLGLRSRLLRESEDFHRDRHRMDPSALDSIGNILLHELQRHETDSPTAQRNIHKLLVGVPDYLGCAVTRLNAVEPLWKTIMEETAEGLPELFKVVVTLLPGESEPVGRAQTACERYREAVLKKKSRPEGSFALGASGMQRRVRDDLALPYTLGQLDALAGAEILRVESLLQKACRKFKGQSVERVLERGREQWKVDGTLLELYQSETSRIARAFKKCDLVTFPKGETLEVRPVPRFMQHLFPTAAYTSPGAFEKKQRGIFWVNDLSLQLPTVKEKEAEQQQHFGLALTAAHEAYPGHHLQFVTSNRHPRKWRRLFQHAIFYEGWTLWCEQMMVDYRMDSSPYLHIQQLHDALWRCHRIRVDIHLQTGRWTALEAGRYFQKALGFTARRARAEINWYSASPSVPMSYWLGRLENERLKKKYVDRGGWSMKQFNDWLLSFGTIPQGWIERYGSAA